jgi:cytoskeletal protein RodZ
MTDQPLGSIGDNSSVPPSAGGVTPPPPPPSGSTPPPTPPPPSGKSQWFENIAIVIVALLCCWPLGLVLVWLNKKWTNKTKWSITGVMIGIAVVGILIGAISGSGASNTSNSLSTSATTAKPSVSTTEKSSTTSVPKATTSTTAKATTTTTAAKNSPKITKAEFEQIQNGMSRQQVADIVGSPGEVISQSDMAGISTVMVKWDGSGSLGANANAMFQNDKLISKAQLGLS